MYQAQTRRLISNGTSIRSNDAPLTDDQIRKFAPSIFATEAHESRSERYAYIPTIDVLQGLRGQGFEVFMAGQARTRDEGRREHTKHMVRLRHIGDAGRKLNVGDSTGEIVLINSHDGTSSYQMYGGMYRLVCSNGLMVSESQLGAVKVPHMGKIHDQVINGAYEILDGFTRVIESKEEMESLTLNREEQAVFARAALALRFDVTDTVPAPVTEDAILRPRRMADSRDDVWTTFNRIQENLVKGGLRGRNALGRPTTTREVKSIDQNVKINRALWMLTEGMMNLKQGRPVEDLQAA